LKEGTKKCVSKIKKLTEFKGVLADENDIYNQFDPFSYF